MADMEVPGRRKGGRPKLAAVDSRRKQLDVRLTQAEWDLVRDAAGLLPVRVWARNELIQAAHRLLRTRPPRDG